MTHKIKCCHYPFNIQVTISSELSDQFSCLCTTQPSDGVIFKEVSMFRYLHNFGQEYGRVRGTRNIWARKNTNNQGTTVLDINVY